MDTRVKPTHDVGAGTHRNSSAIWWILIEDYGSFALVEAHTEMLEYIQSSQKMKTDSEVIGKAHSGFEAMWSNLHWDAEDNAPSIHSPSLGNTEGKTARASSVVGIRIVKGSAMPRALATLRTSRYVLPTAIKRS